MDLKDIQGARVLLVEDNEINQQVALEILQGAGLVVTVANDGREGVEAAIQNPYDAILMDIQMPVVDGYAATRKIREWEVERPRQMNGMTGRFYGPNGRPLGRWEGEITSNIQHPTYNTPIIAMTAHAMSGDDQKSLDAGMSDHVTKPIDPDQLFAALHKWIRPAAERAEVHQGPPAAGGMRLAPGKGRGHLCWWPLILKILFQFISHRHRSDLHRLSMPSR